MFIRSPPDSVAYNRRTYAQFPFEQSKSRRPGSGGGWGSAHRQMQSDFNGSITRIGEGRRGMVGPLGSSKEERRRESLRGNETRQVVGRPYAATSMHLNWLRPHSSCSGSLPPLIPPRGKWYPLFCISLRPERYTLEIVRARALLQWDPRPFLVLATRETKNSASIGGASVQMSSLLLRSTTILSENQRKSINETLVAP